MRSPIPLLALVVVSCAPVVEEGPLVAADKTAYRLSSGPAGLVFVDGAEASTDESVVGPEVRVVDLAGEPLLRFDADQAVRGLALGTRAVATLEMQTSIANQRLIVRSLDEDSARTFEHENPPIALTATDTGFLWVEAAIAENLGDGLARFALRLHEVDEALVESTPVTVEVDGGVVAPFGLLAPFPRSFGLVVEGDQVFFAWTSLLCQGAAEVFQIHRGTGLGASVWRGRQPETTPAGQVCECTDLVDNVVDFGEALLVMDGAPVVVGSTLPCAGVVAERGFVVVDDVLSERDSPIEYAVVHQDQLLVEDEVETGRSETLTGLVSLAGRLFFSTRDGVFELPGD